MGIPTENEKNKIKALFKEYTREKKFLFGHYRNLARASVESDTPIISIRAIPENSCMARFFMLPDPDPWNGWRSLRLKRVRRDGGGGASPPPVPLFELA